MLFRSEQLSIVNYSGFENIVDPFALIDSDGNRWGVDLLGKLSTLDNAALTQFLIPGFIANYDELLGTSVSEAGDEVTVVRGGIESAPGSTLTYTYTALPDEGVIRLLVAWSGGDLGVAADGVDTRLDLGANPALLVAQAFDPVFVSGVVLDDSDSGSGGTLPALTFTWGNLDPASTASLAGSQFTVDTPFIGVGAGETAYFLYYFALNDTGVGGLADLTRLNTPGPQELIGLSAEVVANVRNFDIEEFGGRLQEVLGADGVDDILTGHRWGDSIVSGTGDDVISALGSDDIVRGGIGEDQIDRSEERRVGKECA